MLRSGRRQSAQAPPSGVNLYCSCCDAQLGTFVNLWIRLASAYARPRVQGKHVGSEIGKKIKIVPPGEARKAAEGCGLAEVFCDTCSSLIGQFCETAPDAERQVLIGHHFYKMSRTYLKDSQTFDVVEPIYGSVDDPTLLSSMSSRIDESRRSFGPNSNQVQTPVTTNQSRRDSLVPRQPSRSNPASISSKDIAYSSCEDGQKNILERLVNLERKISDHTTVIAQLVSLQATVDQQATLLQDLQSQIYTSGTPGLRFAQSPWQSGDNTVAAKGDSELDILRKENRELKARLATIMSAMAGAAAPAPEQGQFEAEDPSSSRQSTSQLGKRKRGEADLGGPDAPSGSRPHLARILQENQKAPQVLEDSLPTPHSTQGSRELSVAMGFIRNDSAEIGPSIESDALTDLPKPGNSVITQYSGFMSYASSNQQTNVVVAQAGGEDEVVQFSDDDVAGLHLPTAELVPSKRLTIQQHLTTSKGACDDSGRESPINLDQAQHFTPDDIRKQIEEDALPKPPKEPVEPKERVQSTEKYLNAELEELGLAEWIGRDKKNAEFRAVIDAARTANREAKKKEALARRGLKPSPMALSNPQPMEAASVPEKPATKNATKVATKRSRRSRMTTEPLAEITNRQKNKAATPASRKRIGKVLTKAATSAVRASEGIESEQGLDSGEENTEQFGVMTRRQQRESEIRKRDQMVQEVMELEEA